MAKKFVRGITGVKNITNQDFDTNNVNDILSDGEHNYIHRKKGNTEEYHNLTDNLKTISSSNTDLIEVTNNNKTNNTATLNPKHDTQKEQVLQSTRNTVTINHGANGTDEKTSVDTNPEKVLEHDNLTVGDGLLKSHTPNDNVTNLSIDFNKVQSKIDDIDFNIEDNLIEIGSHDGNIDQSVINEINTFLSDKEGMYTFAYLTDLHFQEDGKPYPNSANTEKQLQYFLALDGKVDSLVLGGDNFDASLGSHEQNLTRTKAYIDFMKEHINHSDFHVAIGNHDDGSADTITRLNSTYIKRSEFHNVIYKQNKYNHTVVENKTYAFKDYPSKQIRQIILDSEDINDSLYDTTPKNTAWITHVYSQEQLNWLANTALQNVPAGYTVVLTTHCPLYHGWTDEGARHINHQHLKKIISDYMSGTQSSISDPSGDYPVEISYNFTGAKKVAPLITGHLHKNNTFDWDGVKSVVFTSGASSNKSENLALSIIAVDTENNKLKIKGFGRAIDREVDF